MDHIWTTQAPRHNSTFGPCTPGTAGMRPFSTRQQSSDAVSEAEGVAVAVADVEVAAAVGLIADGPRDGDAVSLEFFVECVGVVDPDIRVPGGIFRVDETVRMHAARDLRLFEHDRDAGTADHGEAGRFAPETVVVKAKLVAVEVCGCDDVIHDEVGSDAPARSLSFCYRFRHGTTSTSIWVADRFESPHE